MKEIKINKLDYLLSRRLESHKGKERVINNCNNKVMGEGGMDSTHGRAESIYILLGTQGKALWRREHWHCLEIWLKKYMNKEKHK